MTKFSRLSRFGMTYKPLTESRGEELLTLYLADFHARTLAQPEKVQELKETNPQCGNTWQGSLGRLDPSTSLWRTAQCSLLEDLELSLQTFPRWGLMQNGALYQLPMLVRTISEKEYGLEPNNETFFHTPNTMGLDGGSNSRKALKKRMWLTPRVVEVDETPENFRRRMNNKRPNDRKNGFGSLTMQVKWPTPMSTEHKANRQTRENHQNGLTQAVLQAETKMLPTPCNRDYKGAVKFGKRITKSGKTQNYGEQLPNVVGGQLNPTWVEWLMGWPAEWTDLKPLEMDKFLYVQQQHGDC
jgi:DNA (cytosine-5)-methyltransferase 1